MPSPLLATPCTVAVRSPASVRSEIPVTVTVCRVFQFAVVNVSAPDTAAAPAPPAPTLGVTVTDADGMVASFTVNVFVLPSFTVSAAVDGSTRAVSKSATLTDTLSTAIPW